MPCTKVLTVTLPPTSFGNQYPYPDIPVDFLDISFNPNPLYFIKVAFHSFKSSEILHNIGTVP